MTMFYKENALFFDSLLCNMQKSVMLYVSTLGGGV